MWDKIKERWCKTSMSRCRPKIKTVIEVQEESGQFITIIRGRGHDQIEPQMDWWHRLKGDRIVSSYCQVLVLQKRGIYICAEMMLWEHALVQMKMSWRASSLEVRVQGPLACVGWQLWEVGHLYRHWVRKHLDKVCEQSFRWNKCTVTDRGRSARWYSSEQCWSRSGWKLWLQLSLPLIQPLWYEMRNHSTKWFPRDRHLLAYEYHDTDGMD